MSYLPPANHKQNPRRNRILYGLLILLVTILGLASRRYFEDIPFVRAYVGDGLWALMVFLSVAFFCNWWSASAVTLAAFLFSVGIELSQLYHAPWIDNLRASRLGGLALGFGFLWSDILCYSVGIACGTLIDTLLTPTARRGEKSVA